MTTTTHTEQTVPTPRTRKPEAGRPLVFVLLLALAAAAVLALLVAGPLVATPIALAGAGGILLLVVLAWVVGGPRW